MKKLIWILTWDNGRWYADNGMPFCRSVMCQLGLTNRDAKYKLELVSRKQKGYFKINLFRFPGEGNVWEWAIDNIDAPSGMNIFLSDSTDNFISSIFKKRGTLYFRFTEIK